MIKRVFCRVLRTVPLGEGSEFNSRPAPAGGSYFTRIHTGYSNHSRAVMTYKARPDGLRLIFDPITAGQILDCRL